MKEEASLEKKSIIEHFKDLQSLIIHIFLIFVGSFSLCCYYVQEILTFVMKIFSITKNDLRYFSLIEPFFLYIKIGFICGVVFSIPFIFIRLLFYLLPIFKKKLQMCLYLSMMVCFFAIGIFLATFFIVPKMIHIMFSTMQEQIPFMLNASDFFGMIFLLIFLCGVIFEIPLVIIFLLNIGIITLKQLKKFRKFNIVLSFIVGAIVTPPDITSQIIVAVLLIALFEITLLWCTICKGTKE